MINRRTKGEMKKYIGITIGPIFETINMSSTPSALWLGSFCFSLITKSIIKRVGTQNIISPFYDSDNDKDTFGKGIGVLPDRVIIKASDTVNLQKIKEDVFGENGALNEVADFLEIDKNYFREYIMVQAVEYEAENPILESDKYLSSLELTKKFIFKSTKNEIIDALSDSKNVLIANEINSPLLKQNRLLSIPEILNIRIDNPERHFGKKLRNYYAIVRSDGDNMSNIISGLNNDDAFKNFSKICSEYCKKISEVVNDEYNGVTVYSSGDDLLAIMPCVSDSGKTVFEFVKNANEVFKKAFSEYNVDISLSFGITIAFEKFPLYEALRDSQTLLFDVAKRKGKNCLAINLQKHSGQSSALIIKNYALDSFINLQNYILKNKSDDNDLILLSASQKITQFGLMLDADSTSNANIENLFVNFFDAYAHKDNRFVHTFLPNFYKANKGKTGIINLSNYCAECDTFDANAMVSVLRIIKFFVENGD